ncbi:flagellar export protein FliJ [Kordiimonas pumila]|uniref:Flagellar FliJ family protein n=1 Tax=Kordiimonas pumila TaxID=2161677 RepID=A0ABV7D6Z3_9PROT|nr:flagellar FliJ family protein [Kordiimonas pumila]
MASRLDNIIRLRQWELDEERRNLAILQGKQDALYHEIHILEEEVIEQKKASSLEVFSLTVGAYMAGVRKKQDLISHQIDELEQEISKQQDKVAESFRELKTYEIAREQEQKRIQQAEAREEQQTYDEQALRGYARGGDPFDSGF